MHQYRFLTVSLHFLDKPDLVADTLYIDVIQGVLRTCGHSLTGFVSSTAPPDSNVRQVGVTSGILFFINVLLVNQVVLTFVVNVKFKRH